ncbi:MAG: hypothetical protein ACT4P4_02510, partial [Betaproteobacteria bacterium]
AAGPRDFAAWLRPLARAPCAHGALGRELRAIGLAAKGARRRAQELARASLREAAAELKREPGNAAVAYRVLLNRALLGERSVLADYRRWANDLAPDALVALDAAELEPVLHALVGEPDQALARLREYWQRPAVAVPSIGLKALLFVLLGERPAFRTLVDDAATNAPRPVQNALLRS